MISRFVDAASSVGASMRLWIFACAHARSTSGRSLDRRSGANCCVPTLDLHGLAGVDPRVDHHLVAGLEAVERARPRPRRALDLHGNAGARRLAEAARERVRAELRVEHDAVAIEHAAHDGAEERVVADAADRDRIHALDAGVAEALDLLLQLLRVGLAGRGDAVAHEHDALRLRALRLLTGPAEGALEVGRAERRRAR